MKFTVEVYEVKRNPDPRSKPVLHKGELVPSDTVPKRVSSFDVIGSNHDRVMATAKSELRKRGLTVRSMSIVAIERAKIVAYVFKE